VRRGECTYFLRVRARSMLATCTRACEPVQQKRCVKREPRCAHSRRSHAREIDGANWLSPITFIRLKRPVAAARSASFPPFFVPFRVHFHYRAIQYCAEVAWRHRTRTRRIGGEVAVPVSLASDYVMSYIYFFS